MSKVKPVKVTECSSDLVVESRFSGKAGQVQNWGLERWLLRDEGRVLLRALGQGLER